MSDVNDWNEQLIGGLIAVEDLVTIVDSVGARRRGAVGVVGHRHSSPRRQGDDVIVTCEPDPCPNDRHPRLRRLVPTAPRASVPREDRCDRFHS
jgi:hypothetical protein